MNISVNYLSTRNMDHLLKKMDQDVPKLLDREDAFFWPNSDPTVWMRSCEHEVIEPMSGKNFGTMPTWLKGTLLRNGPGSLKVGEYRFDHLFDSSALLHRFEIKDGKVTYQRRFVQTDAYKRNHAAQRIVLTEFGTSVVPDPCRTIFQRVAAVFNAEDTMTDNSMISVYPFGDEFYTFTEAPFIHRIDPETLETKSKLCISNYVGVVNHTAHPHVMTDGTVYNLGMSITARGPAYSVICFPPNRITVDETGNEKKLSMFDQATVVATVHSRWTLNPSYMHTFGITDNYFIIIEQPLSVALLTMAVSQFTNDRLCSCLKWYENEKTLIHLISRKTGLIERTFVAEPFFFLHIINQFETSDGKYVVLDVCCYKDAKMLDCMYIDVMKDMHSNPDYAKLFRGRPLRFILPIVPLTADVPKEYDLIEDPIECRNPVIITDRDKTKDEAKADLNEKSAVFDGIVRKKATAERLSNGKVFVSPEMLCDLGCETPRIKYSLVGKEYRYFYAISSDVDMDNPGTIIKVDTVTKTTKTWCENNVFPSEPIFVPNPNGKKEDDGVIVSALIWGQDRETEVGLLVLDAETLEEIARSTFDTPGPVPKCLHGTSGFWHARRPCLTLIVSMMRFFIKNFYYNTIMLFTPISLRKLVNY
ncbi:carotenoid isomerooxygenase isoform X2 [Neodiprion lecontei]|uniref:Carotenoid isomerooxygenase isoform X2 n=1 Tax=Neodiprion lecontei TaxID=441921 RepID=A0ABM3FPZ1_NEOLC|nr:carotenoid isomerooxygenase isoform X2 [Neodiprion lecontei]